MTQNQRTEQRRRLLKMAAAPTALLTASPAYAFLDWIAEKAAANRKKLYEAMPDKALVDAFYLMLEDGKKESPTPALVQAGYRLKSVNLGMLALSRRMDTDKPIETASSMMNSYVPDADADPVAAVYGALCKGRGNTVKVYKPAFAGKLSRLFNLPVVPGPRTGEWFGSDLAFIEWSPEGRVVSLLLHAFQSSVSLGEMLHRYPIVIFGPTNTRHVENQIRNSEFVDFELRTL